jgi:hypothetical protein
MEQMYAYKSYDYSPWAVVPCRMVKGYQYFGGMFCLHWGIEEATPGSSRILVLVYLTIQSYIPEDQTRNEEVQCGSKYI